MPGPPSTAAIQTPRGGAAPGQSCRGPRGRLGQAWAGTALLSVATTLPELVTTASLAGRGAGGIALGNVLGTCLFNLFILTIVDAMSAKALYARLSKDHLVVGSRGCTLLALGIIGIACGASEVFGATRPRLGPLGVTTVAWHRRRAPTDPGRAHARRRFGVALRSRAELRSPDPMQTRAERATSCQRPKSGGSRTSTSGAAFAVSGDAAGSSSGQARPRSIPIPRPIARHPVAGSPASATSRRATRAPST